MLMYSVPFLIYRYTRFLAMHLSIYEARFYLLKTFKILSQSYLSSMPHIDVGHFGILIRLRPFPKVSRITLPPTPPRPGLFLFLSYFAMKVRYM